MKHLGGVCVSISLLVSIAVAHAESWALTLVLTPNCSHNVDAVQDVAMFLRRHPEVQGSGVLLVELYELDTVLPHVRELVGQGMQFVVDPTATERLGLTVTPVVLFQHGEQTMLATGRPDLERLWQSLHNR